MKKLHPFYGIVTVTDETPSSPDRIVVVAEWGEKVHVMTAWLKDLPKTEAK